MSGGPKTDQGKAITRMNATAHGLRALVPVIPGEEASVWEGHRGEVVGALAPVGAMETALAERIALLLWRLGRVARYEIEAVHISQEEIDESVANRWKYSSDEYETTDYGKTLESVKGHVDDAAHDLKLIERIKRIPDDRTVPKDAAQTIIYLVSNEADIDEEEFDYPVSVLPAGVTIEDVKRWTAGMVRGCLDALAQSCERTVEDLLASCVYTSTRTMIRAGVTARLWERQTDRFRRERILLEGPDLDRVMRYEAHLHRQMVQTLHELEAMQERRAGKTAPLARLDVSGLDTTG